MFQTSFYRTQKYLCEDLSMESALIGVLIIFSEFLWLVFFVLWTAMMIIISVVKGWHTVLIEERGCSAYLCLRPLNSQIGIHLTVMHGQCNADLLSQRTLSLCIGWYLFPISKRVGGWVDLCGWLHTKTVYPRTVAHLSTNLARRRVTSLMRPMPWPAGQRVSLLNTLAAKELNR